MSNFSFTVAEVMGIPIKVNISVLLMIFLLISNFGYNMGIALGVGLMISIVLHELAHSFVAIKKGCRVVSIDLMLIGGAAKMVDMPRKPMDEFQMAIAGPAMSAAIGFGLYFGLPTNVSNTTPGLAVFFLNALRYIGIINMGLAVFNLLPAFPMDGGRIFRSLLATKKGRVKATFVASRLGRILAVAMAAYALFGQEQVIFMLLLIAGFVFMSAGQEYKYVVMQEEREKYKNNMFSNFTRQFGNFQNFRSENNQSEEPIDSDVVEVTPPPYEKKKKTLKKQIFRDKNS